MKNSHKNGFTFIEMLVVVSILVVLISISVFIFRNISAESRDTKRVNDIKQIQLALDMYRKESGSYPQTITLGSELINTSTGTVFLKKIPANPTPKDDGDCPDQEYQYTYTSSTDTYTLSFCISNSTGDLSAGNYQANISGITKIVN